MWSGSYWAGRTSVNAQATSTMSDLRRLPLFVVIAVLAAVLPPTVSAQDEPPPPIGPFVLDLHGILPSFPDDPQLAESRGMLVSELPGRALGIYAAAHFYPYKWKAVTF